MVGSWRGKDAGKDSDKKYDWLYMDVKKDGSFEMIDVEAANPVGKGYFYGDRAGVQQGAWQKTDSGAPW